MHEPHTGRLGGPAVVRRKNKKAKDGKTGQRHTVAPQRRTDAPQRRTDAPQRRTVALQQTTDRVLKALE
jgi:hypothetical protein